MTPRPVACSEYSGTDPGPTGWLAALINAQVGIDFIHTHEYNDVWVSVWLDVDLSRAEAAYRVVKWASYRP